MSDHGSSPRAFADPVIDITDMYVFPTPQRPGWLSLVLNVFPFAKPTVLFSDAVDYRFRLRPLSVVPGALAFAVGQKETTITCRFSAPTADAAGGLAQMAACNASSGHSVSLRVNDEAGGQTTGLRVFAGIRLDPFFFDGARMGLTLQNQKLSFEKVGRATVFQQNVLALVVEMEIASVLGQDDGSLFAVVGETVRTGPISLRLERFGRLEIKNFLLAVGAFDPLNKAVDLRDLFNQEDAFHLGTAYQTAYHSRMNANLHFYDGLDGKTDWPLDAKGAHPLTDLLMADFMVVDVAKPFSSPVYLDIERALLKGEAHQTCGGRSLNEDATDHFLTVLVNNGNGPPISDGVDQATIPATEVFPYLNPPEMNPPPLQLPSVKTA